MGEELSAQNFLMTKTRIFPILYAMKIIADENIPFVREAFSTLGDVTTLAGRAVTAESVRDADMLLVRSVTRVGKELLTGGKVKFVATATIGFDHIDVEYLKKAGIGFASAPGCNSNSVAEYVLSALFVLAERKAFSLTEKTVGIVGCGNVGSKVRAKMETLGVKCLVNDPPLKDQAGDFSFVELDEIFSADIVTLHVPLERGGKYPTFQMVDESFLGEMKSGAALINSSRGKVVDERALLPALQSGRLSAVLDVWQNEPNIDAAILEQVELATPHIAGYSYDGKVRGTEMIYEAACKFFGFTPTWRVADHLPSNPIQRLEFPNAISDNDVIRNSIHRCYDIREDDARLRQYLNLGESERGAYFDNLRKTYPVRREFPCTEVVLSKPRPDLTEKLKRIGFSVKTS
jgi:erythronate-4-phosphate dehydrogenase